MLSILSLIVLYMLRIHINYQNQLKMSIHLFYSRNMTRKQLVNAHLYLFGRGWAWILAIHISLIIRSYGHGRLLKRAGWPQFSGNMNFFPGKLIEWKNLTKRSAFLNPRLFRDILYHVNKNTILLKKWFDRTAL